jgi:hypothetical protein
MGVVAERRILKAQIKEKRREVLPRLRAAVKHAKKARSDRLKQCRKDCKDAQRKAKRAATEARKKLEQHIKRAQKKAFEICKSCKVVDDKSVDALQKSVAELDEAMKEVDKLRKQAGALRSEKGRAGGRKAAELRSESDSQVIHNLDDNEELIALFKKVRGKIKPTKHMSRTEAFFQFLHDTPEALDEFRAQRERKWEKEAERMFAEREAPPCLDDLEACRRELAEYKAAEKFIKETQPDIPF